MYSHHCYQLIFPRGPMRVSSNCELFGYKSQASKYSHMWRVDAIHYFLEVHKHPPPNSTPSVYKEFHYISCLVESLKDDICLCIIKSAMKICPNHMSAILWTEKCLVL